MMDFLRGRRIWERNGNNLNSNSPKSSPSKTRSNATAEGPPAPMEESGQSSQNASYNSDWNSNQFLASEVKRTDIKNLEDSFLQQYNNIKENANAFRRCSPTSPQSPYGGPGCLLQQKDLSYDDLSKNIDANLAEIDMETFRSEDIHSILGIFPPADFPPPPDHRAPPRMDSSGGNRPSSEDEISISKDEPLFSPLREPPAGAAISVDSLDASSSSFEQDLVLTCQANKNNYTIVFEGSGTQFSDDSDYQDGCRSSEEEGSLCLQKQLNMRRAGSMAQSELGFTTWGRLWKSQRAPGRAARSRPMEPPGKMAAGQKSQSLPDLGPSSLLITDKQLAQWAKWCGSHRFPLYEVIQGYQATHIAGGKQECLHSVSLLKLFLRHRHVASSSSIGSSVGQSETSSTSLILQPLNFRNSQGACGGGEKMRPKKVDEDDNDNAGTRKQAVDNIQLLEWTSLEANNNNTINDNNNQTATDITTTTENDNSQYLEDSLMDGGPSPPLKHFHATPIKEEEETDVSSGDEVMGDSRNPFGSDGSSSGEVTIVQNNALGQAAPHAKEVLDRMTNIHPSHKATPLQPYNPKRSTESHSTQTTKALNMNDNRGQDTYRPLQSFSCRTTSNQTDCENVVVNYVNSRDSSPASSGYVSSRHSSVERLRHSTTPTGAPSLKTSTAVTTTCTCGTQIPVHVKDSSMQTTTLSASTSSGSGFTLKESTTALPEPGHFPQNIVKVPLQNISSQTKQPKQKDRKSVYVCYPNYSLPDLSFLRSVIEENSESVFLTPTEYKLPQEIINQKRPSRPKSYGAYESLLQKHMTKIKDWESLNVLLPDDLKLLLQKNHPKETKADSPRDSIPVFHQLSSSYCNMDDASKLKTNLDSSFRRHVPRSILRKSNSVEQCEDRINLPPRCTSASSVMGRSPDHKPCDDSLKKQFSPCTKRASPITFEGISPERRSYENDNLLQEKNITGLFGESLSLNDNSGGSSKKAVKFCERSPTKNSKHADACKVPKCCGCDANSKATDQFHSTHCSCDHSGTRNPQDFLISPTQNLLLYPEITDSYTLQNFSGGGKFFQEALRRKTGLVENLRKATQVIFEHHKASIKKGVDPSVSMGQKILTWLCPAVHTILSDGLLPSVQGFFGPLPNSPWKVAGASIKQGETRKDVEELLNHVNSEKLLTDSTYRFNAFILGLLNLGAFEWWLGHVCGCAGLVCQHYAPTALLSLLALPAASHLRGELRELVAPLSALPFALDILLETKVTSGEHWKKYEEGNFRPESCKDLNLACFSPSKQNNFSLKSKQAPSPCNSSAMNIHPGEENQVWPGITINPFPNAKFAEEFSAVHKKEKNLVSSGDSGCSVHQAVPAESPSVDVKEGQGFKLLRQKWEKMSHSPVKVPPTTPHRTPTKSPANAARPTLATKSKAVRRVEVSPPKISTAKNPPATRPYSQTPPATRRQTVQNRSMDTGEPKPEARRSQIPTPRFGKKSMIPVQKQALRTRSANRDARFCSD